MNITIQLNTASIDAAVRQIEEYNSIMRQKCTEFAKRLGEIGLAVVNASYVGAAYAGTNDIEVHLEFGQGSCKIVANGSTLGFIEFGTGVNYPLGEYAGQAGAPAHGTYGQRRGATGKKWIYKGEPGTIGQPDSKRPGLVWTDGNPPANAFPRAVEAMKEEAQQIAREVFTF